MERSKLKRQLLGCIGVLILFVALGVAQRAFEQKAAAQAKNAVQAPRFEVDPLWPKPLPNHWVLGNVIGVWADEQDHIWIIHRASRSLANNYKQLELTPPWSKCCAGAPPVLEFDQAGNLLRHWGGPPGGPGYEWMDNEHGITVDYKGNVWLGGGAGGDSQVMKFTKDGKFLMQVGKKNARLVSRGTGGGATSSDPEAEGGGRGRGRAGGGPVYAANSLDMENFGRPTKIFVDPKTNEAFVSDGYINHRVVVMDADTGKFKRIWGAYGNKPDDKYFAKSSITGGPDVTGYDPDAPPAQQFRNPVHCVMISRDDLLYVCDRQGNRLQVFTRDGKFVKEAVIEKRTFDAGSVWDIAFSADPQQTYLYVSDGENELVHILRRDTLQELTAFGDGGRQPGMFYGVHSIATDSKGNIYTGETYEGRRVQRFLYKGTGPVTKTYQGTLWPNSSR